MSKTKQYTFQKSLCWATYNFLLFCSTVIVAPLLWGKALLTGKYRGILLLRLGFRFPDIVVDFNKENFWVHAVSLGEVKAAGAFIESLKKEYPEKRIYLSTLTQTGFLEAKKIPGIVSFILPGDLVIPFLMKKIQPETLFLVEGDIWPNMVMSAKRVIVINGKISQRTVTALRYAPFLKRLLLEPICFWCVQSNLYADRLKQLGVAQEKIHVTGDIKISMRIAEDPPFFKRGVLLVSSHPHEENLFLESLDQRGEFLMIAPRHPARFDEVEHLLRSRNIPYVCSKNISIANLEKKQLEAMFLQQAVRVLLINEIGKLPSYFKAAICTVVGGSFFPGVGGHNLIEPLLYGSFPLYGPFIDKQLHLKALLHEWGLHFECNSNNLQEKVLEILGNSLLQTKIKEMVERAQLSLEKPLSATLNVLKEIGLYS